MIQGLSVTLSIEKNHVAYLTLNRPDTHNAMDDLMIHQLGEHLSTIMNVGHVRVVVLRGEGRSFCAGADLKWMRRMAEASMDDNLLDAQNFAQCMGVLRKFPKPTVAVVQGNVMGGGVGLVACCDIVLADDSAVFGLPEVKLGLIPAVISPYVVDAIGQRQAGRYFLTGERFSAKRAQDIGLVNDCYPAESLNAQLDLVIEELLKGSPSAQEDAKRLLAYLKLRQKPSAIFNYTATLIAERRAAEDAKEGMSAFFDKRPPSWAVGA